MSNPSLVLKENDSHLQEATHESRHPDFEEVYQVELEFNLEKVLKELSS
jgi:hypothetical protein